MRKRAKPSTFKRLPRRDARRHKAAILLGTGKAVADVARAVGVHRNTIAEWRADPEFAALVKREADAYLEQMRDGIRQYGQLAYDTLGKMLRKSKNDGARARLLLAVIQSLGGLPKPAATKGGALPAAGGKIVKVSFTPPPGPTTPSNDKPKPDARGGA